MTTPTKLVVFYPSPRATPTGRHAPVAQGIEQRPPEPCAQVRILPGAPSMRCPKTPSPAETLRPGSSRVCSHVVPIAATCPHLRTSPGRVLQRCPGRATLSRNSQVWYDAHPSGGSLTVRSGRLGGGQPFMTLRQAAHSPYRGSQNFSALCAHSASSWGAEGEFQSMAHSVNSWASSSPSCT